MFLSGFAQVIGGEQLLGLGVFAASVPSVWMEDKLAESTKSGTRNRGFASMDAQRQREIASKGGQSVPDEKRSFSRDPSLAAKAGRKGGQNVPHEKRSFSQDHTLAAQAGRKGGQNSHGGQARRQAAKNTVPRPEQRG
jgi:general stress protein YciG